MSNPSSPSGPGPRPGNGLPMDPGSEADPRAGRPHVLSLSAPLEAVLDEVVAHLDGGGLLVYPTETVYGVGADATPEGVAALRALKGREEGKPFLVLAPPELRAEGPLNQSPSEGAPSPSGSPGGWVAGLRLPEAGLRLAGHFWPGPLTMVIPDPDERYPEGVRSENGGVAVRRSPHPFLEALLARRPRPLLSTSANPAGAPPEGRAEAIAESFAGRPGAARLLVLDAGELAPSPPSTLVELTGGEVRIIREGAIPRAQIEGAGAAGGEAFTLLFVCTGNTCRSPLAAALARREAERRGWKGIRVRSAGIAAFPGEPASDGSLAVAREAGLDLSDHRSRPLDGELVAAADLILTMSAGHLEAVFHLGGEGKGTLLTAFADGVEGAPHRGWRGVSDPYGNGVEHYRETYRELEKLVTRTFDRLAPVLAP